MFSILLSSTGLVVNKHFCLEELQSTALFVSAPACSVGVQTSKESLPDKESISKKNCCDDQCDLFKLSEEVDPNSQGQSLIDLEFNPSWFESSQEKKDQEIKEFSSTYLNYKPPLIFRDVILDIQTFLC